MSPPVISTFSIDISCSDTCYTKIELGDSIIYEQTLWPGNVVNLNPTDPVKVSLGNAPGVRIVVNGNELAAFPEGRRVRVIKLGRDGIVRD